jgi:predicted DNA binding CopG/RHH family protein
MINCCCVWQKKRREEDDAAAEAALEALFLQLEKDLELDGESGEAEDDDDITEEEMIAFEQELNAVLGLGEDDEDDGEGDDEAAEKGEVESENGETGLLDMVMKDGIYGHTTTSHPHEDQKLKFASNGRLEVEEYSYDSYEDEDDDYDEEEEEEEEQRTVKLEKWQLKKLAVAVEKGRRHVNVRLFCALPQTIHKSFFFWGRVRSGVWILMLSSISRLLL